MTFREACLALGLSEKTLRKRIVRGEVEAWQVEGERGKEWRVAVPAVPAAPRSTLHAPGPEGREEGEAREAAVRDPEPEARSQEPGADVYRDLYRELCQRHEDAMYRLGYLESQTERLPELAATAEEARARAQAAEALARDRELLGLRCRAWMATAIGLAILLLLTGIMLLVRWAPPGAAGAAGSRAQAAAAATPPPLPGTGGRPAGGARDGLVGPPVPSSGGASP